MFQICAMICVVAPTPSHASAEDIFEAKGKLSAPMAALKPWQKMMKSFATNIKKTPSDNTRVWNDFMRSIEHDSTPRQILKVNLWFNAFPYKRDDYLYGKSDHWASPTEFLEYGGDCEDYTIIKYITLRLLGLPAESMKIAMVYDVFSGTDHALLIVKHDDETYVLDNRENLTIPANYTARYKPHYVFNEEQFWTYDSPLMARKIRKDNNDQVLTGNQ